MNERIKELILKAGFPKFDKMYVVSDGEELEKFAELLLADFIDALHESCFHSSETTENSLNIIIDGAKKHFGVKE